MSLGPSSNQAGGEGAAHSVFSYAELALHSDEALMAHLQEGHHDALAVLFDRYHRLALKVALRILRDTGEAEDLVQSVFLEILRCAAQFNPARGSAKVWILQYVYHRGFNRRQYLNLRGIYLPPERPAPARKDAITNYSKSPDALISSRTVEQALRHLNKLQRKTLEMAFYEGLTMHEIAESTGESFDSVRHYYYRGLEKLRSILCEGSDPRLKLSSSEKRIPHVQP